jgi:hypothetical protein
MLDDRVQLGIPVKNANNISGSNTDSKCLVVHALDSQVFSLFFVFGLNILNTCRPSNKCYFSH